MVQFAGGKRYDGKRSQHENKTIGERKCACNYQHKRKVNSLLLVIVKHMPTWQMQPVVSLNSLVAGTIASHRGCLGQQPSSCGQQCEGWL